MTAEAALDLLHRGDAVGALALLADEVSSDELDSALLVARGMVHLANDSPAAALTDLRKAAALGDTAPTTLLNLALAEQKAGDPAHALRLMEDLERRLPDWDEPPLRLAEAFRAAGKSEDAERAYGRALEINPRRESALLGLAGLLIMRGCGETARDLLLRCCGIAPDRAEAWDALGLALLLTDERSLAEPAFAEAQSLSPQTLQYALHRVEGAFAAGSQEALLTWLEVAREEDPLNHVLPAALGVLLEHLGRRPEAIDAFEAATVLAPDAPYPATLLANALAHANRVREAEAVLRNASTLDPDNDELRDMHASIMLRLYRHAEARSELLACIERHGERPGDLGNLANATNCLGLQDEAEELARRAIALAPDLSWPRRTLCNVLPYRDGITGAELLAALKDCSDRLPRQALPQFANTPDPERRLVIGLLSGSFTAHPVGWLTVAGFETLDPAAFAVVCLAQNDAKDWMARRFRAMAREWHDVDTLSDTALAMKARDLGIDILIDLGGYGEAGRMAACAHRLAPVQMKWVGMQNHSTGLAEMDWIITDRWETPPELEPVYSERPLRLPDGYVCYSPPPYAPDVVPAAGTGQWTHHVRLLQQPGQDHAARHRHLVRRSCIASRTARLVLKTHQFADPPTAERVLAAFAERMALRRNGSSFAVLRVIGRSWESTIDIDIVLDPFPYSGGLTTCEALWMGVPTVTVPGETFASRHSMSHLSNAGLADWVAPDLAAYVELAVRRTSDIPALADLRAGLRAHVKASPLCDAPRFGRNLSEALRRAWRAWCER